MFCITSNDESVKLLYKHVKTIQQYHSL